MSKWPQDLKSPLAAKAKYEMGKDPKRVYHVWGHVERMFYHAEHTLCLDYDPTLARAIIAHDVVYDTKPQKEWRSADWFLDKYPKNKDAVEVVRHIMRTETHALSGDNRIVMLDLADFLFTKNTHDNFYSVFMEATNMYPGVSPSHRLEAGAKAITSIHDKYTDSELKSLDNFERMAFMGIRTGLERVLLMYEEALKAANRVKEST